MSAGLAKLILATCYATGKFTAFVWRKRKALIASSKSKANEVADRAVTGASILFAVGAFSLAAVGVLIMAPFVIAFAVLIFAGWLWMKAKALKAKRTNHS